VRCGCCSTQYSTHGPLLTLDCSACHWTCAHNFLLPYHVVLRRRSVELAPLVLVLCPNIALCQQVVRSVNALLSPDGRQLLRAAQVSSSAPPPIEPPDVVVATPGGLAALFDDRGRSYGSAWTAEGVSAAAEYVVVDEADLLSQGGYAKHMLRLLEVCVCVCVSVC
jgi:superfamily II DNA/RNA helicase